MNGRGARACDGDIFLREGTSRDVFEITEAGIRIFGNGGSTEEGKGRGRPDG